MSLGTLLIRADASVEIGTGHVMRCLALAQAWQDAGGAAAFLMAQCTPSIRARLSAENCSVLPIAATPGSLLDSTLTIESAMRSRPEWIVIDGYNFASEYQQAIKDSGHLLLCIDDMAGCTRYPADVVLNQNLNASAEWYRGSAPGAQVLAGSQFCLLRREFAAWRRWQREIPAVARQILVTLGGSTRAEFALLVMQAIDRVRVDDLRAVLVVGGSSVDTTSVERYAAEFSSRVSIRKDPADVAELMAEADVAISAAGSTCWELCHLGLPAVLLDIASNQTPVALALAEKACAVYAGHAENIQITELAAVIERLARSRDARILLSTRCRQLIDGRGAERVVQAMRRGPELAAEAASASAHA